ncbi:hypothetical protein ACFV4G_17605 [Kitasatospora sp. NPDC059747]|uniref:hypothetical protein n=1 Tax=Kitasatospora sp. NPDC059747 TaxID=3346930 RepID=UPI0036614A04
MTAPSPAPDPRSWGVAPHYAGMQALIGDLVVPDGAPMHVASALETSRELIRHSYHRYEFATVAVTHGLLALNHVLAEPAGADEPLRVRVQRAAAAGLLAPGLAAEVDRAVRLRERLAQGAVTSGAVGPERAVAAVRAVFDAVRLLLRPAPPPPVQRLDRLWEAHLETPFPESFRGVDVDGVDLVLLDANVAGLVLRELNGGLDGDGAAVLWACIADLDAIVPRLNEEYCAAYYRRLRTVAALAAGRHLPAAT